MSTWAWQRFEGFAYHLSKSVLDFGRLYCFKTSPRKECCNAVFAATLQRCFACYKTSPDFPSAWGWVDKDWLIFNLWVNLSFNITAALMRISFVTIDLPANRRGFLKSLFSWRSGKVHELEDNTWLHVLKLHSRACYSPNVYDYSGPWKLDLLSNQWSVIYFLPFLVFVGINNFTFTSAAWYQGTCIFRLVEYCQKHAT